MHSEGVSMEMSLHELRELLESRREYVTTGATSERISQIQQDLDLLENKYTQEITELLNGNGYNVQRVSFSIDIVRQIRTDEPSVRYVKVRRLLRPVRPD
jgi:hypothetical protein